MAMLMRPDGQTAPGHLHVVPATARDLDAAAAADPRHAFLRAAWALAAAPDAAMHAALRGDGTPLAAFALTQRWIGPFAVWEVAGSYWPFRSMALAADAAVDEIAALLRDRAMRRALGRVWRLGPVFDDDPALRLLREAAPAAGWTVIERRLGTCFEIDVTSLSADGPWPRASTMRKNRWREKKLAKVGTVTVRRCTGADWTADDLDAIAAIERHSWLAKEPKAGLQFADAGQRLVWERVAADPVLAPMLFGSIMTVGDTPVAFSFGMNVGCVRYQIANNYDARFARHTPGKTLLVRDFEAAARAGVERISWGSGDAGYKAELGATAGPDIVDLLFVRSKALAAMLRPIWMRGAAR